MTQLELPELFHVLPGTLCWDQASIPLSREGSRAPRSAGCVAACGSRAGKRCGGERLVLVWGEGGGAVPVGSERLRLRKKISQRRRAGQGQQGSYLTSPSLSHDPPGWKGSVQDRARWGEWGVGGEGSGWFWFCTERIGLHPLPWGSSSLASSPTGIRTGRLWCGGAMDHVPSRRGCSGL